MEEACFRILHGCPIILIGLMGCGKTTVGRELSRCTGTPLLDMDAVIEEQVGKSIPEIFREKGEPYFRSLETVLLRYLESPEGDASRRSIISTGGGVVLRTENRAILRRLGFCVWLNVEPSVLLQRTSRAGNRPLLHTEDRGRVLEDLLRKRRPLYAETAHCRIDSSHMEAGAVVHEIVRRARPFFRPSC